MASKLRNKIINAKDIKEEVVSVEEWDCKILVRGLTAKRRSYLLQTNMEGKKVNFENLYPDLLIATCYDPETNEEIFESADRDMLNKKSSAAIEKLSKVAMRLSGLDEEGNEIAKKN